MFKIGELSKICDVSTKTLRFYQEQKLIVPVEVDRYTGYRYFDQTSIKKVAQIKFLKKLGFSLSEIQNFTDVQIEHKTKQVKQEIQNLTSNLKTLYSLQKNTDKEIEMKSFINDTTVVGKWIKIGVSNTLEDAKQNNFNENKNYVFDMFKELNFLPNGQEYWVLSWTKNKLFVKGVENPYTIHNNKLIVSVADRKTNEVSDYAVYEKVDSLVRSVNDLKILDDTNIEFVNQDELVGFYNAVDYIQNHQAFDPTSLKFKEKLFFQKLIIQPNGDAICCYENGNFNSNWSKNLLINKTSKTVSKLTLTKLNEKTYLIVEWKSGDYTFGGIINGSYIFEKV